MLSSFVSWEVGFMFIPSKWQLEEINFLWMGEDGKGNYYACDNICVVKFKTRKEKLKKEHFTEDMMQSPLLPMFHLGAAYDGYWTNLHVMRQFEDLVDILKICFPGFDHHFLFDQSSGHTAKICDGLTVKKMVKKACGKKQPMQDTVMTEDCRGPCVHADFLKVGDIQQMYLQEEDKGPF